MDSRTDALPIDGKGAGRVKITIVFPSADTGQAGAMPSVMPLATTLLAALTPEGHDLVLVDMLNGDRVDYESDTDAVAIDEYREQGRLFADRSWDQYGGGHILYQHPTMSEKQMFESMAQVSKDAYTVG
ncbi:MAG: hypothetical protein GY866_17995 [Proteobacteria bacterium]|nr:hypothetical protein [Pseudomonadota bacterium]